MRESMLRKRATRSPRAQLLAAASLAGAVLMGGCGGSSAGQTAATTSGASSVGSGVVFSKCMRANGVPHFRDLGSNGMLIQGNGQTLSVNGVSVNAPAFAAARQKCERYLPHGDATPAQSAAQRQKGLQFANCMRRHGVPNFPDPRVIGSSGGNQVAYLPGINPQAPAVQAGAKACGGGPKG